MNFGRDATHNYAQGDLQMRLGKAHRLVPKNTKLPCEIETIFAATNTVKLHATIAYLDFGRRLNAQSFACCKGPSKSR